MVSAVGRLCRADSDLVPGQIVDCINRLYRCRLGRIEHGDGTLQRCDIVIGVDQPGTACQHQADLLIVKQDVPCQIIVCDAHDAGAVIKAVRRCRAHEVVAQRRDGRPLREHQSCVRFPAIRPVKQRQPVQGDGLGCRIVQLHESVPDHRLLLPRAVHLFDDESFPCGNVLRGTRFGLRSGLCRRFGRSFGGLFRRLGGRLLRRLFGRISRRLGRLIRWLFRGGRLLRAGLGSGCVRGVRGVRDGRVARGSRRTRLRCVSCGSGAVGGIRCAGIGRILRRGRLRRGILLLRVQAGRQHHAAGKQAQGNRQPDRAGHIPPCCIQVFSHVFIPFELFRHPSPPGHCRGLAPFRPHYTSIPVQCQPFCAFLCNLQFLPACDGVQRGGTGETERRWGLLERSPQTPKNFSRLWIDRRQS